MNVLVIALVIITLFPAGFAQTTSADFKFKAAFAQFNIPVQVTQDTVGFLEIDAYDIKGSTFGNDYNVVQYIAVINADTTNPTYVALLTLTDNKAAADLIREAVYPSPVVLVDSEDLVVAINSDATVQIPEAAAEYGFPAGNLILTKETPVTHATLIVNQPTPSGYVVKVSAKEFLATGSLGALETRVGHAWISEGGILTIDQMLSGTGLLTTKHESRDPNTSVSSSGDARSSIHSSVPHDHPVPKQIHPNRSS